MDTVTVLLYRWVLILLKYNPPMLTLSPSDIPFLIFCKVALTSFWHSLRIILKHRHTFLGYNCWEKANLGFPFLRVPLCANQIGTSKTWLHHSLQPYGRRGMKQSPDHWPAFCDRGGFASQPWKKNTCCPTAWLEGRSTEASVIFHFHPVQRKACAPLKSQSK